MSLWLCLLQHEANNPHDTYTVTVKKLQPQQGKKTQGKCKEMIVGHVPLTLSMIFHLFLKYDGRIFVTVTGKRRNKGIGLEILATYSFFHNKPSTINELKELFKDEDKVTRWHNCTWEYASLHISFTIHSERAVHRNYSDREVYGEHTTVWR